MRKLLLLLLLCCPATAPALDTIRIAYPSTSFTTMPLLAAMREGLFQQEGMRVELILMRPDISVTAVVNGQVSYCSPSAVGTAVPVQQECRAAGGGGIPVHPRVLTTPFRFEQ